jgi:hypothetical protein
MDSEGVSNRIFNFNVSNFGVSSDAVYFTRYGINRGLYKGSFKDNSIVKLISGSVGDFIIVDNIIYYKTSEGLFKTKIDGSDKTKISGKGIASFDVIGDYVYCLGDDRGIERIRTDGSESSIVVDSSSTSKDNSLGIYQFHISNGYIYYTERINNTSYIFNIKRCSLDGKDTKMLGESFGPDFIINGDTIGYNKAVVSDGNIRIDSISRMLKSGYK